MRGRLNEPTSGRNHQMMPYNPKLPEPQIPILLPPSFLSQKGWGNLELGRLQSQAGVSFRRKANKDRIAKARTTRHNSLGLLPAIQDLWRVELNSVHGPDHQIQIAALLDLVATRRASGKILQTTQDPSTHRPCYPNTLRRNTRQRSCSAIARTWWGSRGCRSHCNARARPWWGSKWCRIVCRISYRIHKLKLPLKFVVHQVPSSLAAISHLL